MSWETNVKEVRPAPAAQHPSRKISPYYLVFQTNRTARVRATGRQLTGELFEALETVFNDPGAQSRFLRADATGAPLDPGTIVKTEAGINREVGLRQHRVHSHVDFTVWHNSSTFINRQALLDTVNDVLEARGSGLRVAIVRIRVDVITAQRYYAEKEG